MIKYSGMVISIAVIVIEWVIYLYPEHMIVEYLSDLGYEVESQTIVLKEHVQIAEKWRSSKMKELKGNKN